MQIAGIKIIMGIGLRPWSINLVSVDWGPHNLMWCCKTAEDEAMVMDAFDAIDFLREFDNLQPVYILAQAMEVSLIPADFNNNKDLLSQAMEIADISW